ncbi:MAG: phospholipid/cholesterol/gamma-HCH transport system substrate-binding protein, partial [Solirubrobacteraceae bacterium]|nr:phospholipid/cholesterol/gamma-HCH transport system substrate-binding protein [Solirubrobacteraceae bacterium]
VANATGVSPGNEIRLAGVPIGRVTGVALRDGAPLIHTSIDPDHRPIYRNAQVRLRPNTPLSDMYLDIVRRGDPSAGAIPDGGEVELDRTTSPVQISQIVNVFDADVRPRASAAIDTIGAALGGREPEFRRALAELAPFLDAARRLTRETATRSTQTRRLVHDFTLLSSELARRTDAVRGLVRHGAGTMQRLAEVQQPLGELIDELPPTLEELPRSMDSVRTAARELNPALSSLLPAAGALRPALDALRELSPVATTALGRLDRPLPSLTRLLRNATPLASDLAAAFAVFRPQVPTFDRATSAVSRCELAVRKFFAWTPSVFKFAGSRGAFPRGNVQITPDSVASGTGRSPTAILRPGKSCAGAGSPKP